MNYDREEIEKSVYFDVLSWNDGNYVYTIARDSKDPDHYCKKLWKVIRDLSWIIEKMQ